MTLHQSQSSTLGRQAESVNTIRRHPQIQELQYRDKYKFKNPRSRYKMQCAKASDCGRNAQLLCSKDAATASL